MGSLRIVLQILLFALALGGGIVAYRGLAEGESRRSSDEGITKGRIVRAMEVGRRSFSAPIPGYGTARASAIPSIRPRVGGRIEFVDPAFRDGSRVEAGRILFSIDREVLQAVVNERDAEVEQIEGLLAQLARRAEPYERQIELLEREKSDLEARIAIQEEARRLARNDVDREKAALDQHAGSISGWEAALLRLNQIEEARHASLSRVNQIPIETDVRRSERIAILAEGPVLEARKADAQAAARRAALDLEWTEVKSPASGVVLLSDPETGLEHRPLQEGDLVQAGQDVAWILRTDAGIEIPVEIELAGVLLLERDQHGRITIESLSGLAAHAAGEVAIESPQSPGYEWKGKIDRIRGKLDESTRSVTILVRVELPGSEIETGKAFPLTPGMFCRVEIPGAPFPDAVVIPRESLREGMTVHLAREGRLEIRQVEVLRRTEDSVVIGAGLEGGETLILSDIPGATEGLPVEPWFGGSG